MIPLWGRSYTAWSNAAGIIATVTAKSIGVTFRRGKGNFLEYSRSTWRRLLGMLFWCPNSLQLIWWSGPVDEIYGDQSPYEVERINDPAGYKYSSLSNGRRTTYPISVLQSDRESRVLSLDERIFCWEDLFHNIYGNLTPIIIPISFCEKNT